MDFDFLEDQLFEHIPGDCCFMVLNYYLCLPIVSVFGRSDQ